MREVEDLSATALTPGEKVAVDLITAVAAWQAGMQDEALASARDVIGRMREACGFGALAWVPFEPLHELATAAEAHGITGLLAEVESLPETLRCEQFEQLSAAEMRVLAVLREGHPLEQTTDELFISLNTLKFHLRGIYRKLRSAGRDVNWTVRLPNRSATVGVTVSEVQQDDYALVTTPATATRCVVTHADDTTTTTALDAVTGTVNGVKAGDKVACEFTNRLKPTYLTLVKQVANPAAGTGYSAATDWTLNATGQNASTVTGQTGTAEVTHVQVIPGTYQLSEAFTGTPDTSAGYDWTGLTCVDAAGEPAADFTVTRTDGVVTGGSFQGLPGTEVTCTYTNTPKPGSVVWDKVDGEGEALVGSEWTLTGPGVPADTVVTDCASADCPAGPYADQDPRPGSFELTGLVWGAYELTESKAPAGYVRDATPRGFTIGHADLEHAFDAAFVNVPREVPDLPLTGGTSAALFTIPGSSMAAAGVGFALWTRRRTARRHG